jgi:hypothetical protein
LWEGDLALLVFAFGLACRVGQKPNVPNVRLVKKSKMCGGQNKNTFGWVGGVINN